MFEKESSNACYSSSSLHRIRGMFILLNEFANVASKAPVNDNVNDNSFFQSFQEELRIISLLEYSNLFALIQEEIFYSLIM